MKVKIEVAAGISALISILECRCHSGFGPPRSKSASGYGPPFAVWTLYQTFLLSIVCIIFGN